MHVHVSTDLVRVPRSAWCRIVARHAHVLKRSQRLREGFETSHIIKYLWNLSKSKR